MRACYLTQLFSTCLSAFCESASYAEQVIKLCLKFLPYFVKRGLGQPFTLKADSKSY